MGFMDKIKRKSEESESIEGLLSETAEASVTGPDLAALDSAGPEILEADASPAQQTILPPGELEKDLKGEGGDGAGDEAGSPLDDELLSLFEAEEEQLDPMFKDMLSEVGEVDSDDLLSEILFLTEEIEDRAAG
jgi:hypothetical protein